MDREPTYLLVESGGEGSGEVQQLSQVIFQTIFYIALYGRNNFVRHRNLLNAADIVTLVVVERV